MSNKTKLVVGSIVLLSAVVLILVIIFTPKNSNVDKSDTTTIDTTRPDHGVNKEYDPKNTDVASPPLKEFSTTLYGIPGLNDELYKGMSQINQISNDIAYAILNYSESELNNKYSHLTILKEDTEISFQGVKGKIRIGDEDNTINFEAKFMNRSRSYIEIDKKDNGNYFRYYGGLVREDGDSFTIRQPGFTSNKIIIDTKDKEASMKYLLSLKYDLSYLEIEFKDYRSPFNG